MKYKKKGWQMKRGSIGHGKGVKIHCRKWPKSTAKMNGQTDRAELGLDEIKMSRVLRLVPK